MRAIFYIDGFNFYFLRTKAQPQFKWLNLKALADQIVPTGTIAVTVNYYTAPVSGKIDSEAPSRQAKLFSALRTIPEINIIQGRFLSGEKWARAVQPIRSKPNGYLWVEPFPEAVFIHKTEEKGSDVNLAAHLVRDAYTNAFDVAYVLTNDTDLVEPIRIVSRDVKKPVGIVAPCRPIVKRGHVIPVPAPSLASVSDFVHYIDDKELAAAQFPKVVTRAGKKDIHKPVEWV